MTFALFGLALLLRLWGLSSGLPYITNPDESMIVHRALRFGGGDLNPHFFYYPSLSIYLLAFLDGVYYVCGKIIGRFSNPNDFALAFVRDLSHVYLMARALFVVCDAAIAALLYQWGKKFMRPNAALLASVLWMVFPLAFIKSQVAKPDALMVALTVASVMVAYSAKNVKTFLLSGLLMGFAVSAKYNALMVGPAMVFLLWPEKKDLRQFIVNMAVFGSACALAFLVGTPFAVLDFPKFWHDFSEQSIIMKAGVTGVADAKLGYGEYFRLLVHPFHYGLFTLLGIGSGVAGILKKEKWAYFLVSMLLIAFALTGSYRIYGEGYFYVAFPFLFLLAIKGWDLLSDSIIARRIPHITTLLAFALLAPFLVRTGRHLTVISREDTREQAYKWIMANIPQGSFILMDAAGPKLPMARSQLETLYERAVAAGHVKADLFQLQIKANDGNGYWITMTEQPIMVTPPDLVAYSRQVQELFPIVEGIEGARARKLHIVVVSDNEIGILSDPQFKALYPTAVGFYEDLKTKGELLAEFKNENPSRPGSGIRIYRI